jgi:hypothetical protein
MNLTEKKFRELVRLYIKKQLSELNSTSNIDGYSTPFAFDKEDSEEEHKDSIKKSAEVFDFKISKEKHKNTIHEGKSLFHLFRDHPDYTPVQKIGITIREINKNLTEIEKLISVAEKFKNETRTDSKLYWKTTNKFISKIDERISRISDKLRNMR